MDVRGKIVWFKSVDGILVPASIIGWLISAGALGYLIYAFREIDVRSHSVSDTLMNFAFRLAIVFAGYVAVAFVASKKPQM